MVVHLQVDIVSTHANNRLVFCLDSGHEFGVNFASGEISFPGLFGAMHLSLAHSLYFLVLDTDLAFGNFAAVFGAGRGTYFLEFVNSPEQSSETPPRFCL